MIPPMPPREEAMEATPISQDAWPAYVCPTHGTRLAEAEQALECPAGHRFPIVGGIPRFAGEPGYVDAFGAQWRQYRLTQLDSYTGTTITQDRARRCLG